MIRDKRILITGGRGFIGAALAQRLACDNTVTCMDTSLNGVRTAGTKQIAGDVLRVSHIVKAMEDAQIVIHTAAKVGVTRILKDAIGTLDVNYTGTANVLHVANTIGVEHIVCFSTSEIFGQNANCVAEHGNPLFPDATNPRWCYSIGKLAAEHLALGYYHQYELPVTIVRPFNVFGECRIGDYAMLGFIQQALRGSDLTVYGNGSQVRAWCHIDDFCDAVIPMLDNPATFGEAFNIGNPANNVSVKRLADNIIRLCQSKSRVVFQPFPFADITARVPDIGLARKVLGFEPKIGLEDGLRRTIEWVREKNYV